MFSEAVETSAVACPAWLRASKASRKQVIGGRAQPGADLPHTRLFVCYPGIHHRQHTLFDHTLNLDSQGCSAEVKCRDAKLLMFGQSNPIHFLRPLGEFGGCAPDERRDGGSRRHGKSTQSDDFRNVGVPHIERGVLRRKTLEESAPRCARPVLLSIGPRALKPASRIHGHSTPSQ